MKKADNYLAHRYLFDGYAIAVDWLDGGRGVIVAGKDQEVMGRWEYASVTQALAAWMAWAPEKGAEPEGYVCKR